MKLKNILSEIKSPEENINFLKAHPDVKPVWINDVNKLKSDLIRWKNELTNSQSRDLQTINYWASKQQNQIPPIIIADYGNGYKILDGRHRAYAQLIVNKKDKINALIQPQ